jgi:hypothetical protein
MYNQGRNPELDWLSGTFVLMDAGESLQGRTCRVSQKANPALGRVNVYGLGF